MWFFVLISVSISLKESRRICHCFLSLEIPILMKGSVLFNSFVYSADSICIPFGKVKSYYIRWFLYLICGNQIAGLYSKASWGILPPTHTMYFLFKWLLRCVSKIQYTFLLFFFRNTHQIGSQEDARAILREF